MMHGAFSRRTMGFFIGELDGRPIGCISAVAYGDAFGFVGLDIVSPEFRGLGYGLRLGYAALEYTGPRNLGVDGVVAQQENYKRAGFRLAYVNVRFFAISAMGG
jgi:GNAT superfamily N-acetyltransferase